MSDLLLAELHKYLQWLSSLYICKTDKLRKEIK